MIFFYLCDQPVILWANNVIIESDNFYYPDTTDLFFIICEQFVCSFQSTLNFSSINLSRSSQCHVKHMLGGNSRKKNTT